MFDTEMNAIQLKAETFRDFKQLGKSIILWTKISNQRTLCERALAISRKSAIFTAFLRARL